VQITDTDLLGALAAAVAAEHWRADALCLEHPDVEFFPQLGGGGAEARAICGRCLVRQECLEFAMSAPETEESRRLRRHQCRLTGKRSGTCGVTVAVPRDHCRMDVREAAAVDGFTLEEKPLAGRWVWAWRRGEDERWPCYLEERQALEWMADRLRRNGVFA
jgi:hypothetical protein